METIMNMNRTRDQHIKQETKKNTQQNKSKQKPSNKTNDKIVTVAELHGQSHISVMFCHDLMDVGNSIILNVALDVKKCSLL